MTEGGKWTRRENRDNNRDNRDHDKLNRDGDGRHDFLATTSERETVGARREDGKENCPYFGFFNGRPAWPAGSPASLNHFFSVELSTLKCSERRARVQSLFTIYSWYSW